MKKKSVILWLLLALILAPLAWARTDSNHDSYNRRARILKAQNTEAAVAAADNDLERLDLGAMIMAQKARSLGGRDFESLITLLAHGPATGFISRTEADSLFMETFNAARGSISDCQRLFDLISEYSPYSPHIVDIFLQEMDGVLPDTMATRMLRISALAADSKNDLAAEVAESAAADFPDDYRSALVISSLTQLLGDSTYYNRGTDMLLNIIDRNDNPDALISILPLRFIANNGNIAHAIGRRLLFLDPDSYDGRMALIYAAESTADTVAARSALKTILSRNDIYTDEEAEHALKLMNSAVGDFTLEPWFISLIDSLEPVQPNRPVVARTRYLILDESQSPQAKEYLLATQARFPEDTYLTGDAVEALHRDGRHQEALDIMDRYLLQFPDIAETPVNMALYRTRLLYDMERFHEVIDYVDSIHAISPQLPDLQFCDYASSAAAHLEDYRRALDYDLIAIDQAPDHATYYNDAAYFMALLDTDLTKAENYAAKAAEMEPSNPSYFDTYAWVKFRQHDYVTARRLIDECIDIAGEYRQNTEDAIAQAREYMLNPPEDAAPIDEQMAQQQIDLARNSVNRLSFEIYAHAGDIYYMSQLPDIAVRMWQQALDCAHSIIEVPDDTETITDAAIERLERMVETRSYLPQIYDSEY